MQGHEITPGYALVRLSDLATMLAAAARSRPAPPARGRMVRAGRRRRHADREAGNQNVSHDQLADGIPLAAVRRRGNRKFRLLPCSRDIRLRAGAESVAQPSERRVRLAAGPDVGLVP